MIRIALLGMLLWLGGCAAPLPREPAAGVTPEQVLAGEPVMGTGAMPELPRVDILAVDPPMREFLDRYVDREANAHLRLQQLVYAVINDSTFGLSYTQATRTAADTFARRDGNCLSFTNMFVAMAREVGLKVSYQQIDIPPDWEQRGDTFVLNRHINVLVELGPSAHKAVDFNIDDFKSSYDRHAVSDRRAQAHYFSNIGVEKLQAGDLRAAFLNLRRGLQIDDGFSPLWTNLGTLYLRAGSPGYAETSYLQALRRDASDMVAMSNLARLYDRLGDPVRAESFRALAKRHRENNPYYRYQQARVAFFAKDYRAALKDLDFAIRRKPAEDSFLFLRAMAHLQLGDSTRARADLQQAEAIAADEGLKRNYHSKMELLLGEQPR